MGATPLTFQDMILTLEHYWAEKGCTVMQPYDSEVGAGTFHTATILRSLGPDAWRTCYPQPCRRPADGRYGENPNRLQHYYQFQVLLKPSPADSQDLYLGSLAAIGLDPKDHDVRFVEDDWERTSPGATSSEYSSEVVPLWRPAAVRSEAAWSEVLPERSGTVTLAPSVAADAAPEY